MSLGYELKYAVDINVGDRVIDARTGRIGTVYGFGQDGPTSQMFLGVDDRIDRIEFTNPHGTRFPVVEA